MPTCFVIQPFDGGAFDKRYDEILEPAIKEAGLDAYRSDRDAHADILIEAIEKGIKEADICLAEITTDNPNVWYELGYSFALGQEVVMVCAENRSTEYPFDIRHRRIIQYKTESQSDIDGLKAEVTKSLRARLEKSKELASLRRTDGLALVDGLSREEIVVLSIMAGSEDAPDEPIAVYGIKRDAERASLTNTGCNLGLRRLAAKGFIERRTIEDGNYDTPGVVLTVSGWDWIDANASEFVTHHEATNDRKVIDEDDIPF